MVKNSVDCRIARQYLCQGSSFMISAALLALTVIAGHGFFGYALFVVVHGFFLGGYQYSLKMFLYEKVRARNFNRAWSLLQAVQSIPILVGVPITGKFTSLRSYYLTESNLNHCLLSSAQ